jgi:hypothetical protein
VAAPTAPAIDLTAVYTLISGLAVFPRDDDTVQIGSEPPHWLLLHHAPVGSVGILNGLNGTVPVGQVLSSAGADPAVWSGVLARLVDARLLVPATDWSFAGVVPGAFLEPERDSLVHRYGIGTARRVLQARQDAVVIVRGTGRIATAVATSLAGSGLGHVHQQPDRALRLADLPELGPTAGTADPRRDEARRRAASGASAISRPTRADTAMLATNLSRAAPHIKVHAPAAHHRVALVVLAGDGPPSPSLAAELTARRIPHLAIRAGLTTAVIGPFVLPGRSSCLMCALRQRAEIDEGREVFEQALRLELVVPPAQLVCAAVALVIADVLDHLDGVNEPTTMDGTLEWSLGDPAARRRSWSIHPECGCNGIRSDATTVPSSADRRP